MTLRDERLERVEYVKSRIAELKVKIAEHERPENKRHYKFYIQGAELYKELSILKAELMTGKRVLKKEVGE